MSDQEREEVTDAIKRAHVDREAASRALRELEAISRDRHRRKRQRDHLAAAVIDVFGTTRGKEKP
jgi:hypothetical protein